MMTEMNKNKDEDVVIIPREVLAKCFSIQGTGIANLLVGVPIDSNTLTSSYNLHIEKGFLEKVIYGLAQDFDGKMNSKTKTTNLKEEMTEKLKPVLELIKTLNKLRDDIK